MYCTIFRWTITNLINLYLSLVLLPLLVLDSSSPRRSCFANFVVINVIDVVVVAGICGLTVYVLENSRAILINTILNVLHTDIYIGAVVFTIASYIYILYICLTTTVVHRKRRWKKKHLYKTIKIKPHNLKATLVNQYCTNT